MTGPMPHPACGMDLDQGRRGPQYQPQAGSCVGFRLPYDRALPGEPSALFHTLDSLFHPECPVA